MEGDAAGGMRDDWPEGCPVSCPGVFGEGCGHAARDPSHPGDARRGLAANGRGGAALFGKSLRRPGLHR